MAPPRLVVLALVFSVPAVADEPAGGLPPKAQAALSPAVPAWMPVDFRKLGLHRPAPSVAPKAEGPQAIPVTPPATGPCAKLPRQRPGPHPFPAGEDLTFDIDVLGVRAGKMSLEVLPTLGRGPAAEVPVRVRAESNAFFSKVRRIKAEATSYLRPKDLHPRRFREDSIEGDWVRATTVTFLEGEKAVDVDWKTNTSAGEEKYGYTNDALDYVGGIYLFRALPLRVGESFCFETYSMRRLWRVEGTVAAKEHVSAPAGEFDTFHVSGVARRMAGAPMQREVHVWISDDARRLPVVALGVIDLGPVRATLSSISRSDLKTVAANPGTLSW